ncbi:hypothetical protein A2U01_0087714, partial [Trifolium medium]|nr:hypothetical protein [Trifolium medium]
SQHRTTRPAVCLRVAQTFLRGAQQPGRNWKELRVAQQELRVTQGPGEKAARGAAELREAQRSAQFCRKRDF